MRDVVSGVLQASYQALFRRYLRRASTTIFALLEVPFSGVVRGAICSAVQASFVASFRSHWKRRSSAIRNAVSGD